MSNITDWIKYELYPTLFESIDRALPEHEFKKYSGGWRSKTYLTGSPHKDRIDKTVITKKAPGYILEQGGDVLSLVDYIIKRDNKKLIEAVKTLAEVVGLEVPKGEFSSEDYQKYKEQATILEDCNSYFIYCLENSKGADEVKAYLYSRGYSDEDIKAMEIGFIPGQDKLFKYLISKGYSESSINEVVNLSKPIGDTHILSIPYRSGGSIKGFKFRALVDNPTRDLGLKKFIGGYKVMPENLSKYLNSIGLDKIGGFFNLLGIKGDKDIVIVEGELDSLHATIKGVNNVVAIGGSSINLNQVKDAIKRGAKSFTICLDTEPGKEEETINKITSAIDVILGEDISRVYIATLPDLGDSKTDPDRLIKDKGVEAFKEVIAEALPYYKYKLQNILSKYSKIEEFTERDLDNFLDEVVVTGALIKNVVDRERFKKLFTDMPQVKDLGVTEESLSIVLDKIIISKDKEIQATEFKKLILEATKLQESGQIDKALELLNKKVKDVKLRDKATEFSYLLNPISEEDIKNKLSNSPESLKTDYKIGGEELLLPAGAISIFTAPTSHGKTTFLINLALNITENYKDKEVYFFSYEEDKESILIKTLNTYVDEDIAPNNRRTLKTYYTTGSTEYFKPGRLDYFKETKEKFFKELINTRRLNINYSSYNSDELIEAIRYLHKNTKVGAIFIDYIQLLNLPEGKYKTYSRQEEIKEICLALKDIAVETGLPIILGAQFNRTVTNPLHLHPTKIGEAGDIERIASLMVGFWNNNFTPIATEGELKEINSKNINIPNTLYTTILKDREGSVGLSELLEFNGNVGSIKNSSSIKKYL